MLDFLWARVDPSEVATVQKHLDVHPVRVGDIADELGLSVVKSVLDPKISGLIQPSTDTRSGFIIRVNKFENKERQRFTIAHEIAHFLLHRDSIGNGVVDSVLYRSGLTSRKETEANKLAADIVMPLPLVEQEILQFRGFDPSVVAERMAAIFGVSLPAMKVRLGIP